MDSSEIRIPLATREGRLPDGVGDRTRWVKEARRYSRGLAFFLWAYISEILVTGNGRHFGEGDGGGFHTTVGGTFSRTSF